MDFGYELSKWAFGVHCACAGAALGCLPFACYYGALIKHRLAFMTVSQCRCICINVSIYIYVYIWAPSRRPASASASCDVFVCIWVVQLTDPDPTPTNVHSPCSAWRWGTKTCYWCSPRDTPPSARSGSAG